ncbi:MAG: adenine phosphoribosyltransferase [Burkholderia sp.]|nr:adenine phosphoribosyltransferase [Burkholderia sp.]
MLYSSSPLQVDIIEFFHGHIRSIPDWPEPGVVFRDITPLLQSPKALRVLIDLFVQRYINAKLDYVVGIDARGFIIGPVIAYELCIGFLPIRKVGKLPYRTKSESYHLEYGSATVEIHEDACNPGNRVIIFDDLIATGGTMMASLNLLNRIGAEVYECASIIDLPYLGGSKLLQNAGLPIFTLTSFSLDRE